MLKTEKIKKHVIFPAEIIAAIDKTVGGRKRSRFIVEASREKLEKLKIQNALDAAAGCWKNENHPDIKTQKDIRAYLKRVRNHRIKLDGLDMRLSIFLSA